MFPAVRERRSTRSANSKWNTLVKLPTCKKYKPKIVVLPTTEMFASHLTSVTLRTVNGKVLRVG